MTASQQDKPCPQCGQPMVFRLGSFECEQCGAVAGDELQLGDDDQYGLPQREFESRVPPPPSYNLHSLAQGPEETAPGWRGITNRLEREKRGFTVGAPIFLFNMLIYTVIHLNNPWNSWIGIDPAAQAGMDPGAFSTFVILYFAVQIAGLVGAIVLLQISETWSKWFGALGAVLAIGVSLLALGNQVISVITGDMQLVIALVNVCLMAWLFSIFVRELQGLQPSKT